MHSDLRGLLAAWEAMSNSGVDTYSHTLEDDSEVAVTALRNAIRVAGVKWAERNGLRWLASAFLCIRVERGQMFYEPGLGAAEIVFELPA
ncbi:argininosuccinate lyase [Ralstonia solanacearum]|nr:argininosuccinate lyase [Ralstonia solanacearum]